MQINLSRTRFKYVFALLLMISIHAKGFAENWTLAFEIGAGTLDVEPDLSLVNGADSDQVLSSGFIGGYHFGSNAVIEFALTSASSGSFLGSIDNYHFTSIYLSVGYAFNITEDLRLVPKLGLSDWRLRAIEGAFLNPGDETELESNGHDLLTKINLEYSVNKAFQTYLTYFISDFDMGQIAYGSLGFRYIFP